MEKSTCELKTMRILINCSASLNLALVHYHGESNYFKEKLYLFYGDVYLQSISTSFFLSVTNGLGKLLPAANSGHGFCYKVLRSIIVIS